MPGRCDAKLWRRGRNRFDEQIKDLFGKVGSFYHQRENFRLTPEVKAKFTSKLKNDPAGVLWSQGKASGTNGMLTLV